jgi:ATP-dependent RNA helicase DDX3X
MFCPPLLQTILADGKNATNTTRTSNSGPAALIICPTLELAIQASQVLKTLCHHVPTLKVSLATGGASLREQRQALSNTYILARTPGRILQFADKPQLLLQSLKYLVIDEADQLLDLGFESQLTRISRLLQKKNMPHQSVLCLATFPTGVQRIATDFLRTDYYFVSIGRVGSTRDHIRPHFEWASSPGAKEQAVVGNVRDFLQSAATNNNT